MIFVVWLYIIALTGVLLYSSYAFYLAILYRTRKIKTKKLELQEFPFVTIQLPVYNEKYVVERLLENILKIDYPSDKLEIQILDDSTDETSGIIRSFLNSYQADIENIHLQRKDRVGFKAGALKEGLESAKGEFIAIFDADFLPESDFLKKSLPYFQDEKIGVVQTRWVFVNREYSLLTSLQAFALDAHFTVEQSARNSFGHFVNFNGTAGIWRKTCIEEGGDWEANTLTEDLDLSYRSQLKGWKIQYLQEVETPSELPVTISALKKQQFRWNKGGAQCFRKHAASLMFKKGVRFSDRLHGLFHLMNSSIYFFILFALIISFPILLILEYNPEYRIYFHFSWIFLLTNVFLMFVYWTGFQVTNKSKWYHFFVFIPKFVMFLSLSFGLTLHNTIAVLEGWLGIQSPFVRTPKFNILSSEKSWEGNEYVKVKLGLMEFMEFLFGFYFLIATYFDLKYESYFLAFVHFSVAFGFFAIWSFSFSLWRRFQFQQKKVVSIK